MPKINKGPAKALAASLRAARKLFDAQTLEDVELEARKLEADPEKHLEAGLLRYKAGELRHKKDMKAASGQPKFVPPRPMPQEPRSNGPVQAGSTWAKKDQPSPFAEVAVQILEQNSVPSAAKFVKDYSEWLSKLPTFGKTVVEALGPERAEQYEGKYQQCLDLAAEMSQVPSAPPEPAHLASGTPPPFKNPSPSAPPLTEHVARGWNSKSSPPRDPNEHMPAAKMSGHMADAPQWGFRSEKEKRAQLKNEGDSAGASEATRNMWKTGGKTVVSRNAELRPPNPAPANMKAPPNPPRVSAKEPPKTSPANAKAPPEPTPASAKRPQPPLSTNAKGPTQPSLPVEPHHIDEAMQMLKSRGEYDRAWFVEDYALHLANRQRQSQLPIERVVEESRKESPEHARYYEECLGVARGIADAESRASSSRPPPQNDQLPLGYETAAWLFNPEPDLPAGAHEPEQQARVPDSKGGPSGPGGPGYVRSSSSVRSEIAAQQIARKQRVVDPAKIEASLKNDELFRQRLRDNQILHADEPRLKKDLETAKLDRARLNQMLHGDPAHGGERLPLGFRDYGEFDDFKADLAAIVADTRVDGKPITASARQIGSATSFYSGNPKKPLGHHFDRCAAEGKLGDVDIELSSPALAKAMTRVPGSKANPKAIIGGQMMIFKNSGAGGFSEVYPQFGEFMNKWSRRLGREVDIKLKIDATPIASLPNRRPGPGPIEILRIAQ